MDDIDQRIKRIYAALDAAVETDLSAFAVTTTTNDGQSTVGVDFRGGLSDEQLTNVAHTVIHNVAHLKDHLHRWAKQKGLKVDAIEAAVDGSRSLQVIIDLSNSDKHGPPRDRGRSGLAPRLAPVERFMKMGKGDWTGLRFQTDGTARSEGKGSVVISARVVDRADNVIGDLNDILHDAATAWEEAIAKLRGDTRAISDAGES